MSTINEIIALQNETTKVFTPFERLVVDALLDLQQQHVELERRITYLVHRITYLEDEIAYLEDETKDGNL